MTNSETPMKKVKTKGPIRWEAIIPFAIICALIALYFNLFFDGHLRRALEWAGYNAVGAEVNVAQVETSFFNASLRIRGIEITDSENPTHNSLKIGDIRFSMLWDALLRAKVVINEAAVEQIAFNVKRSHPGKVKPPEPVSNEPGMAEKLKEQALQEAQERAGENVLGDIIAMLGGADSNAQLQKLQESLPSKAMLEKFDTDLKTKKQVWDEKLKSLPQGKEIEALGARLEKIKTKDFKTPQELQTSLQDLDKIFKDGESMYKKVQATGGDLDKDLKSLEAQYKQIESQIKTDIKTLEQHFRIPKLDAKALTMALFNKYLQPYKAKFYRYKAMADKYLPPNLLKKNREKEEDVVVQPHPREKGISYEFGRPNAYPLFWVKRTGISSQAGASPEAGNIKGEILNITSNQKTIGKPTTLNVAGDFPAQDITGLELQVVLDNRKPESMIDFNAKVASYAIAGKNLIESTEVEIAFEKANGRFDLKGQLAGLKKLNLTMENNFSNINYKVSAKNEIADQILKSVFGGIPLVTLSVDAQGVIPSIPLAINSNLGSELQKGFEKQIQAKIDEARKKIQALIDQEIGKQKAAVEAQLNQLKGQFDQEIKKAQAQIDSQKKQAESRVEAAKKDFENQGKKQLEKEGQKALDELKKKFGL